MASLGGVSVVVDTIAADCSITGVDLVELEMDSPTTEGASITVGGVASIVRDAALGTST